MAGALQLRRFATTALKASSASNLTQVPASGVTAQVYKQGATVRTPVTVGATSTAVTVYGVGRILAGDNLQVGTTAGEQLTVISVDSDTQLTLIKAVPDDVTLADGDRLVVYSSPPTLYSESSGTDTTPNPVTVGADGMIAFYCPETRFDYIVSGTGITTSLFIDNEGGWMRGGTSWVNVKDYPTFQAAINALPDDGGTVFVPVMAYTTSTVPAVGAMTITKPVHLLGEVAGRDGDVGVRITYNSTSNDLLTIGTADANMSIIENIGFFGAGSAGAGRGLVVYTVDKVTVRNCMFYNFPSYAAATGTGSEVVRLTFDRCRFIYSHSGALMSLGEGTAIPYQTTIDDCSFLGNSSAPQCIRLGSAPRVSIKDCSLEGNENPASANGDTGAFIYSSGTAVGIRKLQITGCWFENGHADATPNSWFIYLNSPSASTTIRDNYFARPSGTTTSLRILKSVGASGNWTISVADNFGTVEGADAIGTDDISLSAVATTYLSNNTFSDAGGYANPMTVTSAQVGNDNNLATVFTKTTTGAPSAGSWTINAMCVNTFDNRLYICTASGAPGTWKYTALT